MATKPRSAPPAEDDFPPLTRKELALLEARMADHDDPTRFVIISPFSRRFCLYYVPADGVFVMNHPPPESLFKRRAEAEAVAKAQRSRRGKRDRKSDLQVIAVKRTPGGVRFLEEVQDRWHADKRWKPLLKRKQAS